MNGKLLISALFFLATQVYGQDSLWMRQTKVGEVIAFEHAQPKVEFLQQNVSLSKGYYPLFDKYRTGNPVVVHRKASEPLPLYAEYFFTPSDSILRLVSYDWERGRYDNFFDKQKIWEEEAGKFDRYDRQYEKIKALLIGVWGVPLTTDTAARKAKSGRGEYLTRESTWETEEVFVRLSMVFESMTYSVRMMMYWKK